MTLLVVSGVSWVSGLSSRHPKTRGTAHAVTVAPGKTVGRTGRKVRRKALTMTLSLTSSQTSSHAVHGGLLAVAEVTGSSQAGGIIACLKLEVLILGPASHEAGSKMM